MTDTSPISNLPMSVTTLQHCLQLLLLRSTNSCAVLRPERVEVLPFACPSPVEMNKVMHDDMPTTQTRVDEWRKALGMWTDRGPLESGQRHWHRQVSHGDGDPPPGGGAPLLA